MVTRYRPREVDYGFDDDVRRPAIGTQAQTAGQETERSSPSRLGGNVGMDGRERCLSEDRKSTRLNSSHLVISYAVFCLKKKRPELRQSSTKVPTPVTPRVAAHREATRSESRGTGMSSTSFSKDSSSASSQSHCGVQTDP